MGGADEASPVNMADFFNESIDGQGSARFFPQFRDQTLAEQSAAAYQAAEDAARNLFVLPEEFEHGNGFRAHLKDAAIGVPASEKAQESAEFDLVGVLERRGGPPGE